MKDIPPLMLPSLQEGRHRAKTSAQWLYLDLTELLWQMPYPFKGSLLAPGLVGVAGDHDGLQEVLLCD